MEIKYNLTEQDYLNFNIFHIKHSKAASRSLKLQRFVTPVFFIAFAFILSGMSDLSFGALLFSFTFVSILWIIFYPKYFYSYVLRNTRKFISEGKNAGLLGEHVMVLTEEGIMDSSSSSETKVTWAGIETMKEDELYLFIYNSSVSAYILPKRYISDIEKVKSFCKMKMKGA